MDYAGKRVSIMGLGRSGRALAEVLLGRGALVFVSDAKPREELERFLEGLPEDRIVAEYGGNTEKVYEGKDLIVISPGVSIYHPVLEAARKQGVPVIGEIELAWQFAKAPLIAVTGTNGKSTTVSLIHRILKEGGVSSLLAGNIGVPLSAEVAAHDEVSWIVAEVSSFQLETIAQFRPRIGVILNITDDHKDRHRTFNEYVRAKARLFENQGPGDYAVLNFDDASLRDIAREVRAERYFFSTSGEVERGAFCRDGSLWFRGGGVEELLFSRDEVPLKGGHNLSNVLAVLTVAMIAGISGDSVLSSLRAFTPLSHRLEYTATVRGVKFYDDSKGTNPGAVMAALESFTEPITLIAGGKDKSMDFSDLGRRIARRVKNLVVIGESAEKIAEASAMAGMKSITRSASFPEAVKKAFEASSPGDVVLLSPACASFDMFSSAEHRGDLFQELVKKMEVEYP
ncbi:MAG: UDP-N-acetylmuramoyl-L-alanine--D-glutamate ligase [Candidatus Eremiobacteraeota bacterium]|nr:UDP-N-acetylmuramoyl-L-alanine--D-glutamate ligase [Candidatus Eremiobacteraeota bacterium]